MKVWELMAILAKAKAGDDVVVSRGPDTYIVETIAAELGDDSVHIIGDGKSTDDPESLPN